MGRGVDLEVEGVRYIEMQRGPHTRPASFKGRRSRTKRLSQCVLVKIWRSTWNTYLIWRLNVVKTFVSTLHCRLENGADLYVNERQKIRNYRARSTEERRKKKNAKSHFLLYVVRT